MGLRLKKSLLKRLARIRHKSGYFLSDWNDCLWLLNHENFVDRQVGVFKSFEDQQIALFLSPERGRYDVFLDVGANFGLYSVIASKRNLADRIIAYEPDPRSFAQLHANLYLNKFSQHIETRCKAVSSESGDKMLSLHGEYSTGTTRIDSAGENQVVVQSVALDDEFDFSGKSIAIKIDIEGHEAAAIQGMEKLLRNNRCFLQVEVFPENTMAVEELMARIGYHRTECVHHDIYFQRDN